MPSRRASRNDACAPIGAMDEIRAIASETDCDLEIFVHGALCVAYSGQCFSSEAWGGRSANRGQCAQACRLPYQMIVDGKLTALGSTKAPLCHGRHSDLQVQSTSLRSLPFVNPNSFTGCKFVQIREN